MSISTKKKRKLIYDNKTYYWHVSPDYDRGELRRNFNILHIIADDKSLEYHIPLELYFNPVPDAVTPSIVKNIIEKSLDVKREKYSDS
jgi:hypothetical protein